MLLWLQRKLLPMLLSARVPAEILTKKPTANLQWLMNCWTVGIHRSTRSQINEKICYTDANLLLETHFITLKVDFIWYICRVKKLENKDGITRCWQSFIPLVQPVLFVQSEPSRSHCFGCLKIRRRRFNCPTEGQFVHQKPQLLYQVPQKLLRPGSCSITLAERNE